MNTNNQLKVKLIHSANTNLANSNDRAEKNIFYLPMGLFPLGNTLRDNGFDVEIIHSDLVDGKELKEIIDLSEVDIIGFDCHWVNQSVGVLDTAKLIKDINPNIFVFLGGYTASLFSEEIVKSFPQVDAVIRGDGEIPIVELCKELQKLKMTGSTDNSALGNVQNLVWKTEDNDVIVNKFTYLGTAEEMEKLDYATIDLLRNWDYYKRLCRLWTKHEPIGTQPLFFLEVGRGCSYACSFCGGNCEAQSKMNNRNKYVMRSVDSVIKTIKKAYSNEFKTFYTCFEYEGSDSWYIELFKRIKQEKLDICYTYGCWRLPSKELVDAMSENFNQVVIEISPETFSEKLRLDNKDHRLFYSNNELEECLSYINTKNNVKVQLYFGFFLAFDTEESILETIKYILSLSLKFTNILEQEYFNFSTDPGSLLFFHPDKYDVDMYVRNFADYIKYIKENYLIKKEQAADMRIFKPKSMTQEQVIEIERKLRVFNYLFVHYRNSITYVLQKTKDPNVIIDLLNENNLLENTDSEIMLDDFKNALISSFSKSDAIDISLIKLISLENEKQKSEFKAIKPTPQIWLSTTLDEAIKEAESSTKDIVDFINTQSSEEKELIVDFDF